MSLLFVHVIFGPTLHIFSTRCNIYILRLWYDVSVHLSVRLSVTEVHWHIIANLGFKFQSKFRAVLAVHAGAHCELQCMRAHCGRGACRKEGRGHLALC